MTTPTQASPAELMAQLSRLADVAFFQNGISEYTKSETAAGNTAISGLNVFRSGTFKDSMGEQHTWEDMHITQMVANFELLKSRGILPNVPVREGHKSFLGGGGDVKGYITSLSTKKGQLEDGTDTLFLQADFEFTEPDAADKLSRGTYRARSAEIGMYESNDMAMYYPVFMGFAFVDIPAVEGLYTRANGSPINVILEESNKVPTPDAPTVPTVYDKAALDAAVATAVAEYAAAHPAQTAEFTVAGEKITDPKAVQAKLDAMHGFQVEVKKASRQAFAKSLADGNKILASDLETVTSAVENMDDQSYEVFKTTAGLLQPHPVVGQQVVSGVTNDTGGTGNHGKSDLDDKIAVEEEIVAGLRHSAMTEEQIQNSGSYKKLQSLQAQKTTATNA